MVFPGAALRLRVSYDARRFDDDTIARLLGHLQTLLKAFAANPHARLGDLTILSAAERRELIHSGTGSRPGPADLDALSDEELDLLLDDYLVSDEATDE
jgi:non-ribosomal peptide synthetase component F